jgi:hypothetical protein
MRSAVCVAALAAALAASAYETPAAADDGAAENLELPPLAGPLQPQTNLPRRKAGELALLYVAGIGWGGSIGVFVDSLQYTDKPAASADPGVLLSVLTAGVGILLPTVVDLAFDKRSGTAQTVASSMLLALGESIALNEYFSNRASTSFHTYTKDASWIFGGTTVGLVTGMTLAGLVHTTPGRAAWVETTGLFGGMFAASLTGAFSRPTGYPTFDREGTRDVGLAGAIAGAAGIAVGLGTATYLSPSVLRVHLIDLGWIAPMAISAAACNKCSAPDTFAAMAISGGIGFGAAFLATMSLPEAWLRPRPERRRPFDFAPYAMPLSTGGFEVGIGGSL